MQKGIIADDNKGMRKFLEYYVREKGFEADVVENAGDLIKRVSQGNYDFAITDYRMPPGMDGLQATAEIKRLKPGLLVCLATIGDPETTKMLIAQAEMKPDFYFDKGGDIKNLGAFLDLVRKSSQQ
ncbi:response regulator [Candidatus Pacearchaeota archaeon]|nr:response regulator [Candidatus Pacearchaeota archaeon]